MNRQANPGNMNTEYAQPGDTIEITHSEYSTGRQYVVVECPDNAKHNPPGCAWHKNSNGCLSYWTREYYKIVKRKGKGVSTPSIVNDTPMDLEKSLRQKRDALLRGYFT